MRHDDVFHVIYNTDNTHKTSCTLYLHGSVVDEDAAAHVHGGLHLLVGHPDLVGGLVVAHRRVVRQRDLQREAQKVSIYNLHR